MCLFPVRAELQEFGRPKLDPEGSLQLPCGKCYECISKRAVDWALRARHEASCHEDNCFITLTYDNDHLKSHLIVKTEFQKFMKKLRKKIKNKVRYMVSHEYGGKTGRPHHHAIIFGWNPSNQSYLMEAPSGEPLFLSPEITKLWHHGYHSIGTANEKTAYYIASYALKSKKHTILNPETGIYENVSDSMDTSKRPAIGADFFHANYKQLINTETNLPRYYVKLLERHYPDDFEKYQNEFQLRNTKPRSAHEKLAKFVITDQQNSGSDSNFRSQSNKIIEREHLTVHLKYDRDNYVRLKQREKP